MSEKEERIEIWRALSDLFLDTEIDEVTYEYIAQVVSRSDYTLTEIENILWHEVYPVLEGNLGSVAGVWEGWTDDWLAQNLSVCQEPGPIQGRPSIINEIRECWSHVVELLPGAKNA